MARPLKVYATFEPDGVAEFQYFSVFRAKANLAPEEKLMFAVLNDAIDCLDQYRHNRSRRGRALYQEARHWMLSDESDGIFSFGNICETLKIDPSYLRLGLLRWLGGAPEGVRGLKVRRAPLRYQNRVVNFPSARRHVINSSMDENY